MVKNLVIALLIIAFAFILKIKFLHKFSMNNIQRSVYTLFNKTSGEFETISLSKVRDMVVDGKGIVLDVRNADEIEKTGMIKGSINIPVGELENRLSELDKNKTYIAFCAVGGRSKRAATILSEAGFKHVYNAEEGMNTWSYPELIQK